MEKKNKNKLVIGIDPDVEKSGIAFVCLEDGKVVSVSATTATFDELVMLCRDMVENEYDGEMAVYIEAGWMNQKSTWHGSPTDSRAIAAKKGLSVGRNQQVAHDIASLFKAYQLNYAEVAPLRKTWLGHDNKITEEELLYFCPLKKRKDGHKHNQEERDATLLAWVYAKQTVRVKPISNKKR